MFFYLIKNNPLTINTLLALCLSFCSYGCSQKNEETILVSASFTLKPPLLEIAKQYLNIVPTANIVFNFGSSGILKQEILTGIPADIFISSSRMPINSLQDEGLVIKSWPRVLCSDKLALIVRSDTSNINTFNDLLEPRVRRIAVGEGKFTSLGYYTYTLLDNLGWLDALLPKFVYAKDGAQALTFLKRDHVDATISYASAAYMDPFVKIAALAPQEVYPQIHFYIAILKDAAPLAEAGDFALFLLSEDARNIFKAHGFFLNGDAHGYQQFKR
jgi:molybdate transport system substrate-binding protein